MSWTITPQLKSWTPTDSNAAAYISAVETADGQALEPAVRYAIDQFVLGCKGDGIWNAIKASCILAGARTLSGALVPLVGAAPTNVGPFVSGDYNRKTGLIGGGYASPKYLNTNRNNNADPQNSKHVSLFVTERGATNTDSYLLDSGETASGTTQILSATTNKYNGSVNSGTRVGPGSITGNAYTFVGISRALSTSVILRFNGASETFANNSQSPSNSPFFLHSGTSTRNFSSNNRLAFYSIGEYLDLALLDARVTTLVNAFGTAIPS